MTYAVDLSDFSNEIKKYSNEFFPELAEDDLVSDLTDSNFSIRPTNIINKILKTFTVEFRNNISLIFKIVGISALCVILKSIQSNFDDSGISEIAFFVCYILIVILIITSFTNIVELCKETIKALNSFMEFLIPIIISLLAVTGKITTVATIQPVLLVMISTVTLIFSNIIMPVIFISAVINIISNVSDRVSVRKLGELFKKVSLWGMEIVLIIFAGILSLEGTLASSVDSLTAKASKSIVSNTVPVVGKLLGDTIESVIGGITVTKNAVGTIGIVTIIAIVIMPIIRTMILMGTFNLASAIIEPIADSRIVKCMSGTADSIKTVFAIMVTITFLFIISIGIMIKVTKV